MKLYIPKTGDQVVYTGQTRDIGGQVFRVAQVTREGKTELMSVSPNQQIKLANQGK